MNLLNQLIVLMSIVLIAWLAFKIGYNRGADDILQESRQIHESIIEHNTVIESPGCDQISIFLESEFDPTRENRIE